MPDSDQAADFEAALTSAVAEKEEAAARVKELEEELRLAQQPAEEEEKIRADAAVQAAEELLTKSDSGQAANPEAAQDNKTSEVEAAAAR
eukprot:scaffold171244_cov13-Tisochrysis_lutea.AAC.1